MCTITTHAILVDVEKAHTLHYSELNKQTNRYLCMEKKKPQSGFNVARTIAESLLAALCHSVKPHTFLYCGQFRAETYACVCARER